LQDATKNIGGDITGIETYRNGLTSRPLPYEVNNIKTPGAQATVNNNAIAGNVISYAGNTIGKAFD